MKTPEDGHPQAQENGLRRKPHPPQLDLRLLASRFEHKFLLFRPSSLCCYGSSKKRKF